MPKTEIYTIFLSFSGSLEWRARWKIMHRGSSFENPALGEQLAVCNGSQTWESRVVENTGAASVVFCVSFDVKCRENKRLLSNTAWWVCCDGMTMWWRLREVQLKPKLFTFTPMQEGRRQWHKKKSAQPQLKREKWKLYANSSLKVIKNSLKRWRLKRKVLLVHSCVHIT